MDPCIFENFSGLGVFGFFFCVSITFWSPIYNYRRPRFLTFSFSLLYCIDQRLCTVVPVNKICVSVS